MAAQEWHQFFDACVRKRVPPENFHTLFKTFNLKHVTLPGTNLVRVLLDQERKASNCQADPRIPLYVREMLRMQQISTCDLLAAILPLPVENNTNVNEAQSNQAAIDAVESPSPRLETLVLQMMTIEVSNGLIKTREELQAVFKSLVKTKFNSVNSDAVGYFISGVLNTTIAHDVLNHVFPKKLRSSLARLLSSLVSQISPTDPQLANTLDFWQKQYFLIEDAPAGSLDLLNAVDLGALSFQGSVLDNPAINTRAGLYVYLNALLYARPLFDDLAVIDFLNMRYKGDVTNLVTDLILASFDVLANAMYRNEPAEPITLLRSFLVNKLPVFLNNYAGMIFPPLSVQYCIEQALLRVDPAAFPSFTQMFDLLGKSSMLSEARQEFLFACALHQLIPEQSIELLLGDVPMQSLPASGRYNKDDLVVQCHASPGKIEELIGELDNMEGNAGEIASALIEIIQTLCANNDTMTLKNTLNVLSRKPSTLDVILLFTRPNMLLQPLYHILDSWQDHEDQGEYQPVYDEFGSILLFILIVRHRFELQDYGRSNDQSDSFVRNYMKNACVSRSPESLTEHKNKLLGGWIRGLFETEGISDELMSMCSPQEFHVLVATLFDQSLKACQAKVLALDTLKGGFEYLLEPFLLPSLIAGLTWFTHDVWKTTETSTNINIILPALQTLVKPPSMSSDSSAMHSAVLSIVAKPLEDSLAHAQRQHPLRVDINPLLETLRSHASKARHDAATYTELEGWAAMAGGGFSAALRSTIQSLVLWSSAATDMSPPHYTHRQLVDIVRIVGAKAVLQMLLDEAMTHFEAGTSDLDIVLDIIVTMIAVPQQDQPLTSPSVITEHSNSKRQLTLIDALHAENADAFELSKLNPPRASMIVRIHRRVEVLVGRGSNVANVVDGGNGGMANAVVHNAEGMPTADIDDILVHAEQADQQMSATQNFLADTSVSFMGVGEGMEVI